MVYTQSGLGEPNTWLAGQPAGQIFQKKGPRQIQPAGLPGCAAAQRQPVSRVDNSCCELQHELRINQAHFASGGALHCLMHSQVLIPAVLIFVLDMHQLPVFETLVDTSELGVPIYSCFTSCL